MRSVIAALSAAGLLSACATSPMPSPLPTVPMQRPEACLSPCPPLPTLTDDDEGAAVAWVHELIDVAGQCIRMHERCRSATR